MLLYLQLGNLKKFKPFWNFDTNFNGVSYVNNGLWYNSRGGENMTKKRKDVFIKENDLNVSNGKIIIDNEELANAIESEEFLIDGEETKDGIKISIEIT